MFSKIQNNLITIQTSQLIIKTNAIRKIHARTILWLQARPFLYHYSYYHWIIPLLNAMPSTIVEAKSLDVFKVELGRQKIPVISNY